MTQIMRAFSRLGKAARYLASTLVIAAGVTDGDVWRQPTSAVVAYPQGWERIT